MTHRARGFSLIELIVVMAILGILGTIGYMNLPRDRYAVDQAAEGLMRDVQYARFQAISRNTFVAIRFANNATGYQIYTLANASSPFSAANVIKNVNFADSRTPRVRLGVAGDADDLLFDSRGVSARNVAKTVTVHTGGDYSKVVSINRQGRAIVE